MEHYSKCFTPLESNPIVFSDLINDLGVSDALKFADVWSIDDPVQLGLIPRPVLALILVLPTCASYEEHRALKKEHSTVDDKKDTIWFQQTIDNACGLYAILHAVCNTPANGFLSNVSFALLTSPPLTLHRTEYYC